MTTKMTKTEVIYQRARKFAENKHIHTNNYGLIESDDWLNVEIEINRFLMKYIGIHTKYFS